METCPNFNTCRLVSDPDFELEHNQRIQYIGDYCQNGSNAYARCKRYIVRETWYLCPDFVLPDTAASPDEILTLLEDKFRN